MAKTIPIRPSLIALDRTRLRCEKCGARRRALCYVGSGFAEWCKDCVVKEARRLRRSDPTVPRYTTQGWSQAVTRAIKEATRNPYG